MIYREITVISPPGPRVVQGPNGCVPTSAALGVWAVTGARPHALARRLQHVLRTGIHGSNFVAAANALAKERIRSVPFDRVPLRRALDLHARGAVLIGIDVSFIYDVPPSLHAVLISSVALPEATAWWSSVPGLIPDFVPGIEIIDPEGAAPERSTFQREILEMAYNAAGRVGLYIPGVRVVPR